VHLIPVRAINQETRFGSFNEGMANLDAHFVGKRRTRRHGGVVDGKWSSRRSISVALLASGALWMMIFWIAKALVA
jgi:hypothetical protein